MNTKIIKPKASSVLKVYIPVMLILLIAVYGLLSSRFKWAYAEGNKTSYILQDVAVVLGWAILFVIFLILMLKKNYYEISKKELVHKRFVNEVSYSFDNVIYIDEEYSLKHNTLLFYNKEGKALFLVMDKKGELLKIFKQNCHNLRNKEEVFKNKSIKL